MFHFEIIYMGNSNKKTLFELVLKCINPKKYHFE